MNKEKLRFQEGQHLSYIELPTQESYILGQNGITCIQVVFENGQMAGVPWAMVNFEDGRIIKVNLAHAMIVESEENNEI